MSSRQRPREAGYANFSLALRVGDVARCAHRWLALRRRRVVRTRAGGRVRVAEILSRKRGLSVGMIRWLHDRLGISAEVLIQPSPSNPPKVNAAPTTGLRLQVRLHRYAPVDRTGRGGAASAPTAAGATASAVIALQYLCPRDHPGTGARHARAPARHPGRLTRRTVTIRERAPFAD
jgi:hypothetical protein